MFLNPQTLNFAKEVKKKKSNNYIDSLTVSEFL